MTIIAHPISVNKFLQIEQLKEGIKFLERIESRLISIKYRGVLSREQAYVELNSHTREMRQELRSLLYS